MSRAIPDSIRKRVAERAGHRCEYCLVPERFLATTFHIDHIRSIKHGGATALENLAYACPHCNQKKGTDVATFLDEGSEQTIRIFNPRKDNWENHFEVANGEVLPKTAIGAASVQVLEMNQPDRLIFRQALAEAGYYP